MPSDNSNSALPAFVHALPEWGIAVFIAYAAISIVFGLWIARSGVDSLEAESLIIVPLLGAIWPFWLLWKAWEWRSDRRRQANSEEPSMLP